MIENKKIIIMIIGCIISSAIGLGCWYILDSVIMWTHTYIIIAIVNFIGYIGYGLSSHIARKCYIK
jgi:CDP-diglyceride synthetase